MKKTGVLALVAAGALACPAVAQAHVSLHPNTVPTGSFATLDIRVPNEETRANTAKLVVQMPPGFTDASIGDVPGWTAKVATHKLAKPVKTDDGLQTEGVSKITWIGTGSLGKIPPGDFQSFPISVEIPGKPGSVLTFKTLQYYDSGKIVRWIGPPDSETPAPTVDVTAPGGVLEDVAGGEAGPAGVGPTASTTDSSDGGSSDTLAIIALIVGALGLVAGGAALIRGRAAG